MGTTDVKETQSVKNGRKNPTEKVIGIRGWEQYVRQEEQRELCWKFQARINDASC